MKYKSKRFGHSMPNPLKRKFEEVQEAIQEPLIEYITEQQPELATAYKIAKNMYKKFKPNTKQTVLVTKRRKLRGTAKAMKKFARGQKHGFEVKRIDQISNGGVNYNLSTTLGTTASVIILNAPPNGTGDNNRIGASVKGIAIHLQFWIKPTLANAAASVTELARILVIYDKFPKGTAPAYTDVIQSKDMAGSVESSIFSLKRSEIQDKFIILRDFHIVLPGTGINGVPGATLQPQLEAKDCYQDWYIPLKGLESVYMAGSGLNTDPSEGGIYLIAYTQNNTTANSSWKMEGNSRYSFIEE